MLKKSVQYEAVKNDVLHRSDHPTADMVYFNVRRNLPRISLATVYRHLENLSLKGLIHKFSVSDEPEHYDNVKGEHFHIYCQSCGRIYDIPINLLTHLQMIAFKTAKIKVNHYQLLVYGICQQCKTTNAKVREYRTHPKAKIRHD